MIFQNVSLKKIKKYFKGGEGYGCKGNYLWI